MPKVIVKSIQKYTQHEIENLKTSRIIIAHNNKDIIKFVNMAKNEKNNKKLLYGKITKETAMKIKKAINLDVENYNIALKSDAVKHIFKKHSSNNEYLRGQVPVTEKDFELIPDIIANYDEIVLGKETFSGKPTIIFNKKINNLYYVVSYSSDRTHSLDIITMWKRTKSKIQ